jgi:energy-coupling factor transporter ATP-binding protein EcfA2
MAVQIDSIELTNYRSCKKTIFSPNAHLSTLIGANGSGKTNILQGILLLTKLAHLTRYHDEESPFTSNCKVKVRFRVDKKVILYEALVNYITNDRNSDEVIAASQRWNFKAVTQVATWRKLPLSFLIEQPRMIWRDSRNVRIEEIWVRRMTSFYGQNIRSTNELKMITKVLNKIMQYVEGINYYGASRFTDPSRCPTSFEIEEEHPPRQSMRQRSEHLSFMYDLYKEWKKKSPTFEEYESIVGANGIGLIDTMDFTEVQVPSNSYQVITGGKVIIKDVKRVLVIPNISVRGIKLSPNQLSEGTFRTLATVFYLIADKSRLLLLEEPEVCVHHGLLESIIEIIKSISKRKQIIVSTHSDYVLDALKPEDVFLVQITESDGTKIRHVPSSMSKRQYSALKTYLAEIGNLGEFWRHGELEK